MSPRLTVTKEPRRGVLRRAAVIAAGVAVLGSALGGSALAANAATTPTVDVLPFSVTSPISNYTVTISAGKYVASAFTTSDAVLALCPSGSSVASVGLQYSLAGGAYTPVPTTTSKGTVTAIGSKTAKETLYTVKASFSNAIAQSALGKSFTIRPVATCKTSSGTVYSGVGPFYQANTTPATSRPTLYVYNNGAVVTFKEAVAGLAPVGQALRLSAVSTTLNGKASTIFISTKNISYYAVSTHKNQKLTATAKVVSSVGAPGKAGGSLEATTVWSGIASYTTTAAKSSHTY